jgi:hypothetical protein
MPTRTIGVNRGNIYGDRVRYSRQTLDFDVEAIIVIDPERVMAYSERAKIKISVIVCLNCLEKRRVVPGGVPWAHHSNRWIKSNSYKILSS